MNKNSILNWEKLPCFWDKNAYFIGLFCNIFAMSINKIVDISVIMVFITSGLWRGISSQNVCKKINKGWLF